MTLVANRRRGTIVAVTIAAIALLAGILHGSNASAGVAQASRAKSVSIVNFAFRPGKLTVASGTSVTFANTSSAPHTATRAGSFDTGRISPGKSKTVKFSRKGTFAYHCMIHPSMHGKIVVQ